VSHRPNCLPSDDLQVNHVLDDRFRNLGMLSGQSGCGHHIPQSSITEKALIAATDPPQRFPDIRS